MNVIADSQTAAHSMGNHPQDHGWRELYRLFAYGLERESPELSRTIAAVRMARPDCSVTHLVTLLGIAVKHASSDSFHHLLNPRASQANRLTALESTLHKNRRNVAGILARRQNSFTAARRFLAVQVVFGAYFTDALPATFADLGTGLGVLPRQLNSRRLFERFADDLRWVGARPNFQSVPLAARYGVDRGPMPDLSWVSACYGASPYYSALYDELLLSIEDPDARSADVSYVEFDILDDAALVEFVRSRGLNAVSLSYVLYEIDPGRRERIIEVLLQNLRPPKAVLLLEPVNDLASPGCTVTLYDDTSDGPQRLCFISDGHLRGEVVPMDDYSSFLRLHPVRAG